MNNIITIILLLIGKVTNPLSIRARNRIGSLAGDILRNLSKKRKNITLDNIRQAFPENGEAWHVQIMVSAYWNLGITLVELLALKNMTESRLKEYVKYKNIELLQEVHSRGRGLILLSGHFGNWEYLAYSAGLFSKIPVTVIVKPQKNRSADQELNKYRTRGGNSIVPMNNAARTFVKELKEGRAVALLADQSATEDKDIFVDFFGRPASTFEAPAKIALKMNVPVVMGFAVRQPDCTYCVELFEIKHDDLEPDERGVEELTKRHVAALERAIRENPGLWSWQHRRWKHQPRGVNHE